MNDPIFDRVLLDYTAQATGLQLQTVGSFVMEHIMQETDFENEARNAQRMTELIASDARLRGCVYIPQVYPELSSKRILTTEWIHGAKLWDKEAITAPRRPSITSSSSPTGLELRLSDVMNVVIELFSVQMFRWGFVHCDPNPGNMFVRRLPSGKPQIVLIDHGLYIDLPAKLRRQYASFWKALVRSDEQSLSEIATAWGMKSAEPWANMCLMRLNITDETRTEGLDGEDIAEAVIEELSGYLGEEDRWPRELIFLERNLSLVQGHNQVFGSPVNRIKLIGHFASQALQKDQPDTLYQSLTSMLTDITLDLAFYYSKFKQACGLGGGFEDDLKEAEEKTMREIKKTMEELFNT